MGTETNYFGLENVKQKALPMKTIDDALNLRNHILLNAEKAVRSKDPAEKRRLLTIVIAGGGPTGVEISGMLAEMRRNIVAKDYPEFSNVGARLYLVDAGKALLGPMSKKSQDEAYRVLTHLGVNVKNNTSVKDYINDTVYLGNVVINQMLLNLFYFINKSLHSFPADKIFKMQISMLCKVCCLFVSKPGAKLKYSVICIDHAILFKVNNQ